MIIEACSSCEHILHRCYELEQENWISDRASKAATWLLYDRRTVVISEVPSELYERAYMSAVKIERVVGACVFSLHYIPQVRKV